MQRFNTIEDIRGFVRAQRGEGRRVSLVPTMGALHAGHRSCVNEALANSDVTVVSIFLNPTQFAPGEDLDRYPADLAADLESCRAWGCDAVFTPTRNEMYPAPQSVWIEPGNLAAPLCGRSRPGHFRGVSTVVAKLFTAVEPDVAVFGQKDAQQALVIRAMVRELGFPVELKLSPIVREADGLALSSRNSYLSRPERERAAGLNAAIERGRRAIAGGERSPAAVTRAVRAALADASLDEIEYVEILEIEHLKEIDHLAGRVLLAAAVFVSGTRLIDNTVLDIRGDGAEAVLLF